jgi:undecaprenyl diphosphate synthase
MDGNGRWASQRGLTRSEGHAMAGPALHRTITAALHHEVRWLTFYSFSTENWKRGGFEVEFLMRPQVWLLSQTAAAALADLGVVVNVVGDFADPRLPIEVHDWKAALESLHSVGQPRMIVNLAFNYGGRQEIIHAVNTLLSRARCSSPALSRVDEARLSQSMWLPRCPDLDLVIRTSGEQRLSNFMIWHAAYAEYFFTDTLWPDFTEKDFADAVRAFSRRRRRWGGVDGR